MESGITIDDALSSAVISVPDAGRLFFSLSRCAAYAAARSGDIPTIKIGKRYVVPVAPVAEKLGLRMKIGAAAA